ncbi:MAG: serine hydrolase [Pseudomonadota bacterium]
MKKLLVALVVLGLAAAAGWWAMGPDWRRLATNMPTNQDVLFWSQAQREAGFRMMDRSPVIDAREISAGGPVRPLEDGAPIDLDMDLDAEMERQQYAALLVVQDGAIRLEKYGLDQTAEGRWTSFSVAKSFTSTLVGAAIKDGYIASMDDDVTLYIEDLKGSAYEGVSVAQLLSMTSGAGWNEDYSDPESDVAQFLSHAPDDGLPPLVSYMRTLPRAHAPGTVWNYSTGETNLIGILVREATGTSLTDYLSEKVWRPYGMGQDASWLTGADGLEISGCCIQAAARDFARFGQFILDGAEIDGEPIVPEGWLAAATSSQADTPFPGEGYGYQWWTYDDSAFAARGIFGQGIFIDPSRNLVIVTNSNWTNALGTEGERERREAFYRRVQAAIDAGA